MKAKNIQRAKVILSVCVLATLVLLVFGYSVKKPGVSRQEFPFSVTWSFDGRTETFSGVYAAEYIKPAKSLTSPSIAWSGYILSQGRQDGAYFTVAETDSGSFSIDLNLLPGQLMGDPRFSGPEAVPTGAYNGFDGLRIDAPAQLEAMGLKILSWEYPQPIENKLRWGGISLSSEAVVFTTALTVLALLACVILVKKDPELPRSRLAVLSAVLNFPMAFLVLPFLCFVSALSEILGDTSLAQQLVYLCPWLTGLGLAGSVALRRCGHPRWSLLAQLAGPAFFALTFLVSTL